MRLTFVPLAVIFDMDGLMLDSVGVYCSCWKKAFAEQAQFWDGNFLLSLVSRGDKECRRRLSDIHSESELDAYFARVHALYQVEIEAGLKLKPGLLPFLDWLRGKRISTAVATSTRRSKTEFILERTGLRKYFTVVVTDDDVEQPKPAPEIYLKVAALLSVSPDRCVVLEDSPYGVEAALAAGMTPIQVPDKAIPTPDMRVLGHCIVESLTDAHCILEQAGAGYDQK
jgi:HAD superfamily hydrolase (TIGR01509 family)